MLTNYFDLELFISHFMHSMVVRKYIIFKITFSKFNLINFFNRV